MPKSMRDAVSPEEWQVRCDLAALYRLLAHFRMTDIIYTHISARLPGTEDIFLINHYGVLFDRMRASDLVRIDVDGNIVEPNAADKPVNQAGFTIHSAIHMARHDAKYVIHTHTQAGIAVASQKQGLLPLTQHALKLQGILCYHDYEGIAVDLTERERLARDLGPHNRAMILRNHGLLTLGATAAEAFSHVYYLERSCQIQLAAQSGGAELIFPQPEVINKTAGQWDERNNDEKYFQTFWNACLQLIEDDKIDYRT